MEDYDKFVKSRLSQLKKSEDVDQKEPQCTISLIRFYGRPILSPLLSGAQKEEMGKHREAAQKAAENRKLKDDTRLAYVQTILSSVQLRKTPTLEELLQESDIYTKASSSGSVSDCTFSQNCPSTTFKRNDSKCLPPLTSTTCSALLASHVSPQTSYSERHQINQQVSYHRYNPSSPNDYSHQILSSDYVSCVKAEDTINSTQIDTVSQKEGIFFPGKGRDSTESFFMHTTSDTVIKMADIINYPPVDGEELEKSGQVLSLENDYKAANSESAFNVDPFLHAESCPEQKECKESAPLAIQTDNVQEVVIKCDLTNRPKEAQTSQFLTEIHIQPRETMQVDEGDSKSPEEPYRMSLQALLKKSQEYRRRQRMLRSQAKNAKIQDRAQDQPKSEEQSLSDKENDEQHTKGTTSELRTSQDRSGTFSPTLDQSLKRSYENKRKTQSDNIQSQLIENQDNSIAFNNAISEATEINNWVNKKGLKYFFQSVPIWTENLNKSGEQSANISRSDISKYHTIPSPNFCRSPIHCKMKSPSAEPPFDKISQREALINRSTNKDHKVEEGNGSTPDTSPPSAVVESDITSVLTKSSPHIDQLEFNLSGLKVLISDLESTLTDNMDKSSSQRESQQTQLSQNDFSVCSLGGDCSAVNGDSHKSLSQDSINENNSDTETEAIHLREKMLVKTVATRGKEPTSLKNKQSMRKQSKCILSTAQRMRIPDIFRTCLPELTVQHNVSILSDTSNYPATQKNDADLVYNSRSPSLNQSYNVDTPSELWLNEGSSSRRCGSKNQLTPDSGSEAQGEGSKVKRRLHMTEDIQEQGDHFGQATCSRSKPNSSTPKAAARRHEGLDNVKERQEQLQQVHAAQIKALQEEHRRQQEELIQALAARYRLLQSMSVPCSMSTSRLGDIVTFPTLSSQPYSPLPEQYRHLLAAVAKGFLTRRLLKTERVGQLVRTVKDTQQFLQAFKLHSPNKELCSRQDLLLQDRVSLQLRSARYEIYDIFFSLTVKERVHLISLDRDLARERELKRQRGYSANPKGKSSLSAATQKSLERKRGVMIQKKTAERHRGARMRTRHKSGFSAEQPLENQRGQFRANPQRVPKSTYTSRPR